jgi:phosphoglycolate phosphatase-like HAD superfamily hydrolase
MHLVVFDIDGTLTQTVKADDECYVRSLAEVCGFNDVNTDWSRYRHATDFGIFRELHQTRKGRLPSEAETLRFRERFVGLLTKASLKSPFAAVPGAPALLSRLKKSVEHRVALATGACRDSARLKMASAGMCFDDYPSACGDDAPDRETILRLAIQRAAERYGKFSSTVYVGDGVWDARACRSVGIPFIGIAGDGRSAQLIAEGAVCVFPDFCGGDLVLSSLDEITRAVCPAQ